MRARNVVAIAAAVAVAALLALRSGEGAARAEPAAVRAAAAAEVPTAPAQLPAPAPAAPASVAAPAAGAAAPAAAAQPAGSEEQLLERVRAEVDAHPDVALLLAEEGDARFPSGASSDERALLRMRALVHLDQIGIARDAAREFFERHPDSPLGRDVFRLTGMRPPPVMGPRS